MINTYEFKHDRLVKAIGPLVFGTREGYELDLPEIFTTLKTEGANRREAINELANQLEELTVPQLISNMPINTSCNDLAVNCVLLNQTLFGYANLKAWKPLNLESYLME